MAARLKNKDNLGQHASAAGPMIIVYVLKSPTAPALLESQSWQSIGVCMDNLWHSFPYSPFKFFLAKKTKLTLFVRKVPCVCQCLSISQLRGVLLLTGLYKL